MSIQLKELANISAGQGAPQGDNNYSSVGVPFVKAGNLQELVSGQPLSNIQKVSSTVAEKHKLKLQTKGSILFAKSGMSCLKGYVYVLPEDAYIVSHLACITPRDPSLSEYLNYYFRFNKPSQLIKDASYPSISLNDIGNIELTVPTPEVREAMVSKLQKLENLIYLFIEELGLLDDLVKSRFVEEFGDPKLNQNKWPVRKVGELVTDVRYGTSRPAVEGGQYPYLRMNNLTNDGHLDLTNLKYINIPDNELEKCLVRRGDILFNRTNSIDLIGKTAVFNLEQPMIIAGYIIRVRLKDELLPEIFALYFNLEYMKDALKKMAKGAVNQANINAQELQSIHIYVPPMEKQDAFVEFLRSIDKSKAVIQKSLNEAQLLFDSLMQEYFG